MKTKKRILFLVALVTISLWAFILPMRASADTHTWAGGYGSNEWNYYDIIWQYRNWGAYSFSALPASGDDVNIGSTTMSSSKTANYNYNGSGFYLNTLNITGRDGTRTATLNLQSQTLQSTTVNLNAYGFLSQTGGTLNVTTYNISGGTASLTNGNLNAGTVALTNGSFSKTSPGTLKVTTAFNQSGGTSTFDTLSIDNGASNVKAYSLTGGTLTAGTVALTNGSFSKTNPGTLKASTAFNQSGGTSTFDTLSIDNGASNVKAYSLTGGTLTAGTVALTNGSFSKNQPSGTGTLKVTTAFNQSGGTSTFDTLSIDDGAANVKAYSLTGGSLTAGTVALTNGSFSKNQPSGTGTLKVTTAFNQSGGTSTFDTLSIDDGAANVKAYSLTGGTLTAGTVALTNGSFSRTSPGTVKVTTAFNQSGGTSTFDILSIDDGASYIKAYNLSGTGILNAPIINLTGGTFKKTGGTLNYTTFNQDGGTSDFTPGNLLINSTYNLAGGELKAAKTINSSGSAFNYSGGIMNSGLENAGVATLSGTGNRTVNGAVTNEGTFNVNAPATATFNGDFTNKGAYISSASSNTFLQNLTITSLGYLQAGIGNLFQIGGNFVNQSTQNTLWNTAEANLAFYNSGSHSLFLAGADFGKAWNGTMETGYFNNFSWGSFNIGSGATVALYDGNTGNTGSALYVGLISGLVFSGDHKSITNISGQLGLNIYYDARLADNSYLEGKIYALAGGGELRPVPLPSAVWLLGAGLIGLVGVRRRFVK